MHLCHRPDYGRRPFCLRFDAPVFTEAVTSEDGSTVQLAYACGTDGWYLQVEGDTSVYTVDTSTVQALLLTENDLKTQE